MDAFVIVPSKDGYWVEAVAPDGVRTRVKLYLSKGAAEKRVKLLRDTAKIVERRNHKLLRRRA